MSETMELFADASPPPVSTSMTAPPSGDDDGVLLHEFAERCYLAYAMSVVRGRALPSIEDGMKPVQRRILYAMHEMGLSPSRRHVKSARVVGDVIGKLHPHGDQSVYDAMVRMAQGFSLRYPLIDGQGNFGSLDGDQAAAMRYTEARLTPIAELLLSEIGQGTVDYTANYDGSLHEPTLLPARLPMLLANGASGIAVGMATEIPPHNLRELANAAVALIRDPDITLDVVMKHVPGPDFPGGGHVITDSTEIRDIYATGRGSLRVRARWTIEQLVRGQWRIVVHELPPGVSAAQVLTEIDAATNPQPKAGKKDLSPEQRQIKAAMLAAIDAARDESDKQHPVRLVIEPTSRNQDPDAIMRLLLAHTSLEVSVAVNMTAIGRDGRPGCRGLVDMLREWVDYRIDTVRRRSLHRLEQVEKRLHILDGRKLALLNIDEVIRVIREADEPKADLMARFGLTQVQAEDILEIRLRQLARLEAIKIDAETAELVAERDGLRRILGNEAVLKALLADEIRADAERHGDDRRTLIEAARPVTASVVGCALVDEPVTVVLSRNGWLRAKPGHGIDRSSIQYKSGDFEFVVLETRTAWSLVVMDSSGRTYTISVTDIPIGRGDGVPLASLIEQQAKTTIIGAVSAPPDTRMLATSRSGYGFIFRLADAMSKHRKGKSFQTMGDTDMPLPPITALGDKVAVGTTDGTLLVFPVSEVKEANGGRGVQLIKLSEGSFVNAVACFDGSMLVVRDGYREAKVLAEDFLSHRARKGKHVWPDRREKMAIIASISEANE